RAPASSPPRRSSDLADRRAGDAGAAAHVRDEAELGRDPDPVADGRERLADEFLARERTVDLGRVEERDARVVGRTDDPNSLAPRSEEHTSELQSRGH